jgi:hypothetical protein
MDADSVGLAEDDGARGLIHKQGALYRPAPAGDDARLRRADAPSSRLFFFVLGVTSTPRRNLTRIAATERLHRAAPYTYTEAERPPYLCLPKADCNHGWMASYTVFGEVIADGWEVLGYAMAAQPVQYLDRPMEDIRMYMRLLP